MTQLLHSQVDRVPLLCPHDTDAAVKWTVFHCRVHMTDAAHSSVLCFTALQRPHQTEAAAAAAAMRRVGGGGRREAGVKTH